jgi:transposase
MGQVFYPYEPDQTLRLPPSLREWVPEGHLAHFVADTVDELDLQALYDRYERRADGRGQLAYEPRLLLKVLIYAYAVGQVTSRKIAKAVEELVPLRYLAAGSLPSHRTLARFRQEHSEQFQGLFVQVVRIAQAAGLVAMGTLAIDGSKVKANASKHKAMSYGRMKEEDERLSTDGSSMSSASVPSRCAASRRRKASGASSAWSSTCGGWQPWRLLHDPEARASAARWRARPVSSRPAPAAHGSVGCTELAPPATRYPRRRLLASI